MATPNTESRLQGTPLVITTLAVALASFMNILDTTIAIVALPTISGNLGATASQGSWVITSYSVCLAVVLRQQLGRQAPASAARAWRNLWGGTSYVPPQLFKEKGFKK